MFYKKILHILYTLILSILLQTTSISQEVIFSEGFENGELPADWTEEYVNGIINWYYQNGGHSEYPGSAHSGNYNAIFQYESTNNESTKLIIPPQDFVTIERLKLELRFWHTQDDWGDDSDILSVYYKKGLDSSWILLETYTEPVINWTQRKILLPDTSYTSEYYIAFEATTGWGHGVCIDDVEIVETGIIERFIDTLIIEQASEDFAATGTNNNPILKIEILVEGNTNDLILDSLAVKSLNSNDNDIKTNGVKLFYTTKNTFSSDNQIGNSLDFQNSVANFTNLNTILPTGYNYVWLSYDIDSAANHGDYIDAQISAQSIRINNELYPDISRSPSGKTVIYESIFYEDFEDPIGWFLTGEFEIDVPAGLGSKPGNPDPSKALSGNNVLGTDLTGLGAALYKYESELTEKEYQAISPIFDATYYKDLVLSFHRWLNLDKSDNGYIEYSLDSGITWHNIWQSSSYVLDNVWTKCSYDIPDVRSDNLTFRFSLGSSDGFGQYSGWNIDDFLLTGDFIANDVGVNNLLAPSGGCGHTADDSVTIEITNYSGSLINNPIPVYFSKDGGDTKTWDTIYQTIDIGETITHTFNKTINLSTPGFYDIIAVTRLDNDEQNSNNAFDSSVFVIPTLQIPYSENFESGESYWLAGGINSSWELGMPGGTFINSAASGTNAWITGLISNYNNEENSYVESPCFDFTGVENPIFELKIFKYMEENSDGAYLIYSVDCGNEWKNAGTFDELYDDIWNWYNSDSIGDAGFDGWTGEEFSWVTAKKLLPNEIAGNSCVKFRIMFSSNSSNSKEGLAFDDVKIYEAPPDIGVTNVISPVSACELSNEEYVEVRIQNFGLDTLNSGKEILVGLSMDGEISLKDTFTLSSDLLVGDSIEYTFKNTVDLFSAGEYQIWAYSMLPQDNNIFDTISNDSASINILVYGLPEYSLGPDIGTRYPDTIQLDAGSNLATYSWKDDSIITQYLEIPNQGIYWVEVTNDSGCIARDTIEIILSDADMGITQIYNLSSECEITGLVYPEVMIKNYGPDSLFTTDSFLVVYAVNDNQVLKDTIVPSSIIIPDSSFNYTFNKGIDISSPGEYAFEIYTVYIGDIDLSNDTLSKSIEVYGFPDVELGADTIYTSQPDTLIFDAGNGFDTYAWNVGGSVQTFNVSNLTSDLYKVTVTDIHACGEDSDSVQIIAYDIDINEIISPVSDCELSTTEPVVVSIQNNGYDTLFAGHTIDLSLSIEGEVINNEYILEDSLLPGNSVLYTFDTLFDFSNLGSYNISVSYSWEYDVNQENDQVDKTVKVYGYPVFDLGPDTIFTNTPDTIELNTVYGYDSYVWQDTTGVESYEITSPASKKYYVKVEDSHGCSTSDTLQIISFDVGIIGLQAPVSSCELSNAEQLEAIILNYSYDTLVGGDMIYVGYDYASNPTVIEDHIFTDTVFPGETFIHKFSQTEDFSEVKSYSVELFTLSDLDVLPNNDSLTKSFEIWLKPDIDLEFDTVITMRPDTIILNAGLGFGSYQWQDDYDMPTYPINELSSKVYSVTVSDKHFCGFDSDSTVIVAHNVGIESIANPESSCILSDNESVSLNIVNYSRDTLYPGTNIYISYSVNNDTISNTAYSLTTILLPDSSEIAVMPEIFDLSGIGEYNITAFAKLPIDADIDDTTSLTIEVYGYPEVDLGEDIYTKRPDTIIFDAGNHFTYLWQDSSATGTYAVSSLQSATYWANVYNEFGCEDSDTVSIYATDIGVAGIFGLESDCELSTNEEIDYWIKNYCHDTLFSGDSILVTYNVNNGHLLDTIILITPVNPGDSIEIISSKIFDLSGIGEHDIQLSATIKNDVYANNDTSGIQVTVYGYPVVDLGDDIIYTGKPDTITLIANDGYESYLWNDGSSGNIYEVNDVNPATYTVSVTDLNGCTTIDSVIILSFDIGISRILSPNNACELSSDERISIEIVNYGMDIDKEDILTTNMYVNDVLYALAVDLSNNLLSGQSIIYELPSGVNLSQKGIYIIDVELLKDNDFNKSNNTISDTVEIYGNPEVIFVAGDQNNITVELPFNLRLEGRYNSYKWHNGSSLVYYSVKDDGIHSVTVTDENNCKAEGSINITVKVVESIGDKSLNNSIRVFPNPVSEELYIFIDNPNGPYNITLNDIAGNTVYHNETNLTEIKINVNKNKIIKGIYLLTINSASQSKIYRIVIQ